MPIIVMRCSVSFHCCLRVQMLFKCLVLQGTSSCYVAFG